MRARNLKPGLFKNEILGEADPLLTVLFEGLWCMADRAGRLEDRPLRICAELFPYRRKLTEKHIDEMLWWLDEKDFIARYETSEGRFIQVLEFVKHQSPHKSERGSEIQEFSSILHRARPVSAPTKHRRLPEAAALTPDSLTPDSGLLTADCGLLTADTLRASQNPASHSSGEGKGTPQPDPDRLQEIIAAYPARSGRLDWPIGAHYLHRLVETGEATWDELLNATKAYQLHCDATHATGTQHVLMPGNFFGAKDKPWKTGNWSIPVNGSAGRRKSFSDYDREATERLARASGEDPGPL